MHIRPYEAGDLDAVVGLSLRAWEPVFASIESAMDAAVYRELHPDWRRQQQIAVAAVCTETDAHVWIAVVEETPAGFVACKRQTEQLGEISMIAVDPAFQRRGIATALIQFAIGWMRDKGISVAMLETGGDPGHAAARRTYEACGFRPLSVARYFKKLEPIGPNNASDSANSAPRPPPNGVDPPNSKPEMTAASVLQILDAMSQAGVEACLDGGWGVDALLGERTRPHADLDLIVSLDEIPQLVPALTAIGFTVNPGWTAKNFVLRDAGGREVDAARHSLRRAELRNLRATRRQNLALPALGLSRRRHD